MKQKNILLICLLVLGVVFLAEKVDRMHYLVDEYQQLAIEATQLNVSLIDNLATSIAYSDDLLEQYQELHEQDAFRIQQVAFLTDPEAYISRLISTIQDNTYTWSRDGWAYVHCTFPLKIYLTHANTVQQFQDIAFIAWGDSVLVDRDQMSDEQRQLICKQMQQRIDPYVDEDVLFAHQTKKL